jgi:hypothetical protein
VTHTLPSGIHSGLRIFHCQHEESNVDPNHWKSSDWFCAVSDTLSVVDFVLRRVWRAAHPALRWAACLKRWRKPCDQR